VRPANVRPKYDGITAHGLDVQDERELLYARDGGKCMACHKPVAFDDFEVAHLIANTIANRKRWGSRIIDSVYNKVITHRGACNSKMNCANKLNECQKIIDLVEGKK
jgi:hypothetical protein